MLRSDIVSETVIVSEAIDYAPYVVPVILGVLTLIGVVVGTVATVKKIKADRLIAAELKPPTFGEMYGELKQLRRDFDEFKNISAPKDRATGNVLRDLAEQLPRDSPPVLDPRDVAEMQDTIPTAWLHVGNKRAGLDQWPTVNPHPTEGAA